MDYESGKKIVFRRIGGRVVPINLSKAEKKWYKRKKKKNVVIGSALSDPILISDEF